LESVIYCYTSAQFQRAQLPQNTLTTRISNGKKREYAAVGFWYLNDWWWFGIMVPIVIWYGLSIQWVDKHSLWD